MKKEAEIVTMGGRIQCRRCQAKAKSANKQCLLPAVTNKNVCRVHGGKSRGPVSDTGREKCAIAKTRHGRETRKIRLERQKKLAELKNIELFGKSTGLF